MPSRPAVSLSRALLACVVVASVVIQPADARDRSASSTSVALGAYVAGAPWEPAKLDAYAALVGRMPTIVMWYQDWGTSGSREFDRQKVDAVVSRGATPMITWEPWVWTGGSSQPSYAPARIAAGVYDAYIREWARAARSWGKRFYLRFAHEMNGAWYPWGVGNNGNTAADFIAAWRHIVDIFREEGVSEVRWVWAPNVGFHGSAPFASVYPGSRYVDVIGMDGYNWGTSTTWGCWKSVSGVFAESYDTLTALAPRKPVIIAETASSEQGGDKAAWIRRGFLQQIPDRFPRIKAVVWFHQSKETSWGVDSSPQSLAAFREVVADPRYQGRFGN